MSKKRITAAIIPTKKRPPISANKNENRFPFDFAIINNCFIDL
jgi:hypothetical protein